MWLLKECKEGDTPTTKFKSTLVSDHLHTKQLHLFLFIPFHGPVVDGFSWIRYVEQLTIYHCYGKVEDNIWAISLLKRKSESWVKFLLSWKISRSLMPRKQDFTQKKSLLLINIDDPFLSFFLCAFCMRFGEKLFFILSYIIDRFHCFLVKEFFIVLLFFCWCFNS